MPDSPAALPAPQVDPTRLTTREMPIAQTPIAPRGRQPGEVTLQFTRWFSTNNSAYQQGQRAGFTRAAADKLLAVRPRCCAEVVTK